VGGTSCGVDEAVSDGPVEQRPSRGDNVLPGVTAVAAVAPRRAVAVTSRWRASMSLGATAVSGQSQTSRTRAAASRSAVGLQRYVFPPPQPL